MDAAPPDAVAIRLERLFAHWRWKHYWDGSTELGLSYRPGRDVEAVVFWTREGDRKDVGFCSSDLGRCQYYPNLAFSSESFEMVVIPPVALSAAYERFRSSCFGQKGRSLSTSVADAAEFSSATVRFALPALTPPETVRRRESRPTLETDALVQALGCPRDEENCGVHLMVPFYDPDDPWVPVYRESRGRGGHREMILYMRLTKGVWWHGATDFNDSREVVLRTKRQIQRALMVDVHDIH